MPALIALSVVGGMVVADHLPGAKGPNRGVSPTVAAAPAPTKRQITETDFRALIRRANRSYDVKRFEEAGYWYARALAIVPDDIPALTDAGCCAYSRERYPEALAYYDRALKRDPTTQKALFDRALTLNKLRRYDEAKAAWFVFLRSNPSDADAASARDNLAVLNGKDDAAHTQWAPIRAIHALAQRVARMLGRG